jgi:putative phosphoribosyl transferase
MPLLDSVKNRFQLRFKNRVFAAKILVGALEDSLRKIKVDKKNDRLLILGVPRGGVIVADIVASKLSSSSYQCEFDIVIPRKLAAPANQEIAIGAIMEEDGTTYLNEDLVRELEVSLDYIEMEKARQTVEIKRRKSLYRNNGKELVIEDQVIIIVDDGAATGATLIAAARWIRKMNPKKLIIAVPVVSKDTASILKEECDLIVTGTTPSATTFKSVGQYYQEFKPVEDYEVIEVCKRKNMSE